MAFFIQDSDLLKSPLMYMALAPGAHCLHMTPPSGVGNTPMYSYARVKWSKPPGSFCSILFQVVLKQPYLKSNKCRVKIVNVQIVNTCPQFSAYDLLVHFKRLCSRHIHKEIKLQKAMNGMDRTLCKTDLILIARHTYKCNTFSDVDFEAFSYFAYVPMWYSQFQ